MKNTRYDFSMQETIFALATPALNSAIAVIRISGKDCLKSLEGSFKQFSFSSSSPNHLYYRTFYRKPLESNTDLSSSFEPSLSFNQEEILDKLSFVYYKAPKSYSGEDSIELFCHGNMFLVKKIFDYLKSLGMRPAEPGEFTLRAVLNKKLSLLEAEAVHELISAQSESGTTQALGRLSGDLAAYLSDLKNIFLNILGALNIQLDYAEDDMENLPLPFELLEEAIRKVKRLLDFFSFGERYQHGIRVVIAGKTNAGKSSLFNHLVQEERSIVSEHAGTTRDYIEQNFLFEGWTIHLLDTAGIRFTSDHIEAQGIERTHAQIQKADWLLYLIDSTQGISKEDQEFFQTFSVQSPHIPLLKIWNKNSHPSSLPLPEGFIGMSILENQSLEPLKKEFRTLLSRFLVPSEKIVLESGRQKELLEKILKTLENSLEYAQENMSVDILALEMILGLEHLGYLMGEITNEEIFENMFSRFCVGK